MALSAGTRLGAYEILGLLGAGGMGEVYRARDTRLDRTVAVKVLAPELAGDAEFRARFTHEAKAISALNHAHICGLYDIGRDHDTEFLVLEFLDGETLAARLERGPLPLAQVLRFGVEIADALAGAHRHGIVHRDLKPGNIMLTAAGTKLLDFGLAKHTVGAAGQALSMLATTPRTGTAQGTIIGTLQYMAPEQVQGAPADARTDIFALGTILYEMATGHRAFEARTQASLIAKILETEVPAVSMLTALAPPLFDHVVQGCLAKEPAERWQTAHDVKMQLQWIQAHRSRIDAAAATGAARRRTVWWLWGVTAASVALAAATTLALLRSSPPAVVPQAPVRFDLTLPSEMRLQDYAGGAISPDGQHFVFEATVNGRPQLVVRKLASTALIALPNTDLGLGPFWSPDGRSVAFFQADGYLKHVLLTGGPARLVSPLPRGGDFISLRGTWGDGVILFSKDGPVYRVAATGGTASVLDTLPWKPGQRPWSSPRFLPDGRHFLIAVVNDPALYVASLDAPGTRKVMDEGADAQYAAGQLVYSRGTGVFARPFNAERLEFAGAEVQLTTEPAGEVSVSTGGTIAYRPLGISVSTLTWFDRSGRRTGTLGEPSPFLQLVLSPSGRRATVVLGDGQGEARDLWDVDLARGIFSRLTSDPADDTDPAWSRDERSLAFTSRRSGQAAVFAKDLLSGNESPLVMFKDGANVDQWTPDGKFLIFRSQGQAVYAVAFSGDRGPRLLAKTPFIIDEVHVSPDGRWVAFNANDSGPFEVYVAAFPAFTSKRQVSSGGGVQPQWRSDGRELFYLGPDGAIMSVRVDTHAEWTATMPTRLFTTNVSPNPFEPYYAVTADGQRFLGLDRVGGGKGFTFLLNWLNAKSSKAQSVTQ